jgi:ribosomal protein S18 acetylase RimI-like enzyme
MGFGDLPSVHAVDASAFDLIWRNSMDALVQAYKASAYATVIELDSRIVGYQICTATTFNAHLARLAVFPDLQRHSLGYLMVQDLLSYFSQAGLEEVTVNTQHNNQSSLALYQKIGFVLTGESIPVYTLTPQLPPNL